MKYALVLSLAAMASLSTAYANPAPNGAKPADLPLCSKTVTDQCWQPGWNEADTKGGKPVNAGSMPSSDAPKATKMKPHRHHRH